MFEKAHPLLMHREGIQVNGHFFKLISFYDNEWGYTSQIFRLISHMYQVDHGVK